MQESTKKKATISVSIFSILSLASSSISLLVPVVDSGLAIGYQTAMTYNIFYIYNINPRDYNISTIILSGGSNISFKILNSVKVIVDNGTKVASEVIKKEIIKQGTKEVTKKVAVETSKQVIKETTKEVTKDILEETTKQIIQQSVKQISKEAIEETTKECVKLGIKETTKQIISKGAIIATQEGTEELLEIGAKEAVKQTTEKIILKEGSKVWLVNLGKAIPFIGAGISGIINTVSTSLLGHRLIIYFDSELKNPEKRVILIKGKILALQNIISQVEKIIQQNEN